MASINPMQPLEKDSNEMEAEASTSDSQTIRISNDEEFAANLLGLANGEYVMLEIPTESEIMDDSMSTAPSSSKEVHPMLRQVLGETLKVSSKKRGTPLKKKLRLVGVQNEGESDQQVIQVQIVEVQEDKDVVEEAVKKFGCKPETIDISTLNKDPKSGGFVCQCCGKVFAVRAALAAHLLTHTDAKPHKCPQSGCNKSFRTKEAWNRHYAAHTGERSFECDICKRLFSSNQSLKEHLTIHSNTKPYKCSSCNKEFRQVSSLSRHQTIHTGIKRFHCEICGKGFTQATYLRSHHKSHTGEKPYRCELCNKVYAHRSDLTRHKIIHTGARPYTCDWCGQGFADSSSRRRHMRDHNELRGTYTCHLCDQYFRRFGLLKTHFSRRHNIIEVREGDAATLKIVGSDSMDLHEADDCTPRSKFIQGQLIQVLSQLRQAKPNTQYQFVQQSKGTVNELLNATRQFRDSNTGVTVEEQDLAVQLAMSALKAQNEVLVCEPELPLNTDGTISEHVYLTDLPENSDGIRSRIEIMDANGEVQYIEIQEQGSDVAPLVDASLTLEGDMEGAPTDSIENVENQNENVKKSEDNSETGIDLNSTGHDDADVDKETKVEFENPDEHIVNVVDTDEDVKMEFNNSNEQIINVVDLDKDYENSDEQVAMDMNEAVEFQNTDGDVIKVVEVDKNIFQMHYDQQPDIESVDYLSWLQTFSDLCCCWAMPLDVELYEKVTQVHKNLLDTLATPKGNLARKEHYEVMSNHCKSLGILIQQHLAAVLTSLK